MLVMNTSYKFTSGLNIKRGGNTMNGNSGIQPTVEGGHTRVIPIPSM